MNNQEFEVGQYRYNATEFPAVELMKSAAASADGTNHVASSAEGAAAPAQAAAAELPTHLRVPTIDLKAVRKRLGLSQSQFADRFGFSAASVRNWEQGRTRPDGAARVLLLVIAKHPDAVADALKSELSL